MPVVRIFDRTKALGGNSNVLVERNSLWKVLNSNKKTDKYQETWKLGYLCPISRKPHMSAYSKNLRTNRNQQKRKESLESYLNPLPRIILSIKVSRFLVSRFLETQKPQKTTGN